MMSSGVLIKSLDELIIASGVIMMTSVREFVMSCAVIVMAASATLHHPTIIKRAHSVIASSSRGLCHHCLTRYELRSPIAFSEALKSTG